MVKKLLKLEYVDENNINTILEKFVLDIKSNHQEVTEQLRDLLNISSNYSFRFRSEIESHSWCIVGASAWDGIDRNQVIKFNTYLNANGLKLEMEAKSKETDSNRSNSKEGEDKAVKLPSPSVIEVVEKLVEKVILDQIIIPATPESTPPTKSIISWDGIGKGKGREVESIGLPIVSPVLGVGLDQSNLGSGSKSCIFPSPIIVYNDEDDEDDEDVEAEELNNMNEARRRSRCRSRGAPSPSPINFIRPKEDDSIRANSVETNLSWMVGTTSSNNIGIINTARSRSSGGNSLFSTNDDETNSSASITSIESQSPILIIKKSNSSPINPKISPIRQSIHQPIASTSTSSPNKPNKRSIDVIDSINLTPVTKKAKLPVVSSLKPRIALKQSLINFSSGSSSNNNNKNNKGIGKATVQSELSQSQPIASTSSLTPKKIKSSPSSSQPIPSQPVPSQPKPSPSNQSIAPPSTQPLPKKLKPRSRGAQLHSHSFLQLQSQASPRRSSGRWFIQLKIPIESPALNPFIWRYKNTLPKIGLEPGKVLAYLFDEAERLTGWKREELRLRFKAEVDEDEDEDEDDDEDEEEEEEMVIYGFDSLLTEFMDLEMLGVTRGSVITFEHVPNWKYQIWSDRDLK